jgi:2-amino-4-hydroxy-6-hydroxymethyldihydropteridine diphosphokinase
LRSACRRWTRWPRLVAVSAFTSDSLLPGQPRYTNAVAALDTTLAPLDLLDALQAIENDQGRERQERWGPHAGPGHLLFGDRLIDEPRLKVPHYHMQARPFVLYPLAELVQPISAWPMAAPAQLLAAARSSAWNACKPGVPACITTR